MSRYHCPAAPARTARGFGHCPCFYSLDLSIARKGCYQTGPPRSGSAAALAAGGCCCCCCGQCPTWQSLWKEQATCVTHTLSPRGRKRPGNQECLSVTPAKTQGPSPSPRQSLPLSSSCWLPSSLPLLLSPLPLPPALVSPPP